MTLMEKRAKRACDDIKEYGSYDFQVIWNKSRTWGSCPAIYYHGDKAAYASGCGYDKLSAVLSEFLAPLVAPKEFYCHGAGLSKVQSRLDELGWTLTQTYCGEWEDGFRIERKVAQ